MRERRKSPRNVSFDDSICDGGAICVKACPTKALRLREQGKIHLVDRCIGCGECIRVCPKGAVSAATSSLEGIGRDRVSVALVSPVLYSQFPGVMPKDVLLGLKRMGFMHTVDMSYFLEMFQCATEEFIVRNRRDHGAPWPLISPVCPVIVRLIAFQFPALLPNVLPVMRPVAIMAQEVVKRITEEYGVNEEKVTLYYINPCPTKGLPLPNDPQNKGTVREKVLGINDIYTELIKEIEHIRKAEHMPFSQERFEFESCGTGNGPLWGLSGGEVSDMNMDRSLPVSGLNEVITYLEKIELGLFKDMEYIELRACPEGCLGGALTAIDKYLAKRAVQQMVKVLGLGRRLSREHIQRSYERGRFRAEMNSEKLQRLFGSTKDRLSMESLSEVEKILEAVSGHDCAGCGAPDCRSFAEDVVRGIASVDECLLVQARGGKEDTQT